MKSAEAEARVVELITLAADLQLAAAALERHRPDGPCDDRCGCITSAESNVTSVTLAAKPGAVGETAIACTLAAESMPGRLEDWHRLLGFVTARWGIDGGVRLALDAGAPVDEVARLAIAEQDCCGFFSFALTIDGRGVALEVRAPDDALPIVHAVFGAPA